MWSTREDTEKKIAPRFLPLPLSDREPGPAVVGVRTPKKKKGVIRPALVMPNPVLSIQTGPVLHSQEPCIRRRCWMICRIIKPEPIPPPPMVSRSLPAIWSTIQQTGLELADYRATCSRVESTQRTLIWYCSRLSLGGTLRFPWNLTPSLLSWHEISFMTFWGNAWCYWGGKLFQCSTKTG